ncbi:uncharacterized protein ACA1_209660 [Acanthamoeba castellanii str. Neff]|uniref:Uncharacterized protein n=1 Tax=Acanthamoeba castellanii (strain ATCC 30010 / Neff) TaxID=1257118 RepID=L8H0V5_ACACF|nr:uncharacterized protein ACA1_209660 [Acanthamoeba castellanii str. Neff]ELR18001.1 hypothetical protein ACA1_209660 [Acanthamoeba castellanii str. Neff]
MRNALGRRCRRCSVGGAGAGQSTLWGIPHIAHTARMPVSASRSATATALADVSWVPRWRGEGHGTITPRRPSSRLTSRFEEEEEEEAPHDVEKFRRGDQFFTFASHRQQQQPPPPHQQPQLLLETSSMMKAMQGSILLLAFLLFAALAAGACSTPNELRSTATTTTTAAARLFSVVGGLEALPLQHQHHIALFGRSTYNLTTGLDQPHLLPLPLDFDHPHHLVVVGATSSYHPGPLNNLLVELFKINNLNNVVEIFNNKNKNNMNKNKNNNKNIDMLLHGHALIEEAVVEGLTRHGATRVETPSSPSPSPSPSWRGFTGPAVARLLLVRPFLALACSVDSSLPSWRSALPSSPPSWWSSASSQLSSIIASVPSAAAATWAWLPSWRSVVPFVQVALGCLLALLGYALATQPDPIHKPLPPIRGYPSSSFWSSWSSPALLALAVTSSLPSWPSWPSLPAVSARMWSMLARPAATATTVRPTAAAASGLRRRRERRLDVGPLDLLLIARSIEACFNAAHAPAQPAHDDDEVPLVNNNNNNNNTRRRERRIDVGPSDLLLMARSIEACFNAAHAPTQPAHAPTQPAHAPAQPAHDDDHHDGDDDDDGEDEVPLVNNTRRRRMMAALHHH